MKIALATVPPWFPNQPYLSIPLLSGILKQRGFAVTTKDMNLSFFNNLLTQQELSYQYDYFQNNHGQQTDEKFKLFFEVKNNFMQRIDGCKDFVRSKDNYEKSYISVIQSFQELDLALKIYGMNYPDTVLSFGDVKYTFDHLNVESLMKFALSDNIFSYYFQKYELSDYICQLPDFVGFGVTTPEQLIPALAFSVILKANLPNVRIILGGAYISQVGSFLMQRADFCNLVNFVLCGYSEKSIVSFFSIVENGGNDFSMIPGIIYRDNGRIIENAIENMDVREVYPYIATPNYDDLPLNNYFFPVLQLPIEISKACYWGRCKFCELGGLKYAEKPANVVLDELMTLSSRYGSRYFSFVSASPSPKHLLHIAEKISDSSLDIKWSSMIRVEEYINEDFAKKLYEGGMRVAMVGFESGSQHVLDVMDKGTKVETNEKVLRALSKAGIKIHAYFMFGFDGETNEDAEQTIEFVLRNESFINSFAYSYYTPIKHKFSNSDIGLYANNKKDKKKIEILSVLLERDFDSHVHLNDLILT